MDASRIVTGCLIGLGLLLGACAHAERPDEVSPGGAAATTAPSPAPPDAAPPDPAPAETEPIETQAAAPAWDGIRVNREARTVELDATVVYRTGEWLELLACSPRTREHESILTVAARPSHIHLALLTIDLQPGRPMTWIREGDDFTVTPATGDPVAVSVIYEMDGKPHERPAGEWVVDQRTGEVMGDSVWLFTGSGMAELEGQPVFRADLEGNVLSLVHFGDDLLARPTEMTHLNDNAAWNANTPLIPAEGASVVLRLRPSPRTEGDD